MSGLLGRPDSSSRSGRARMLPLGFPMQHFETWLKEEGSGPGADRTALWSKGD